MIPNKQRIFQFLLLFFAAGFCCASGFFLRMYHGERWTINPAITFSGLVDAFWWNLKSVLYEELIYRGAILYILLRRLGAGWGIALSSIAFGIYHWFSFQVWGNIPAMIPVFLITGAMGFVLAYSFWRTWSMYAAIGIHLGWNFVTMAVFSGRTNSNQVFLHVSNSSVQISHFEYAIVIFLPMISVLLISFLLVRRMRVTRTLSVENEEVNSR